MPWRKYNSKEGKYGQTYSIVRGVTVRKNGQGVWIVSLEKGGNRKNRTIGRGRENLINAIKIAEHIAPQLHQIMQNNEDDSSEQSAPLFMTYCKTWYENNLKRWEESTQQRYDEIIRLRILPEKIFIEKRVDEIGRKDLKIFFKKMYRSSSAKMVEVVHSVVSGIFSELVDDEFVQANPASGLLKRILPPKNQRNEKDPEPFTEEERDLFLAVAEKEFTEREVMILKFMAFTGVRLGEALAVRKRNIDFDSKTYHVQESYRRNSFGKPKGGKKRFVDLPSFLVDDILSYQNYLKKDGLRKGKGTLVDYLFLDPDEKTKKPFSQRKIQGLVSRVCKLAGLDRRNPHDLRHTYATLLLMKHLSPAYVQKQLGHSSIRITVDIYGHWFRGEGREKLDDAFNVVCTKPDPKPHIYRISVGA